MHWNDGRLRAYLDGELNETTGRRLKEHLAACSACRTRLAQLEAQMGRVGTRLTPLAPRADDPRLAAPSALARFRQQTTSHYRKDTNHMSIKDTLFSMGSMRRWRPALVGLVAVVLAVILLNVTPVRQAFSAFLSLFRVQQIAVLPVDNTRLSELTGDSSLGRRLAQLLSDTVTFTKEPGEPEEVADATEAGEKAGFLVRLFNDSAFETPPRLTVQDSAAFHFAVDRDLAQGLLDETGYDHLKLPAGLDGAVIAVDIPAAVAAAYGDCPTASEMDDDERRLYTDCIILAQTPGPTVSTPPAVDMEQLAHIGLQILGMTPEEAREFSQTVDWTSTLVVPIPRHAASYKQVSVDGVTGNLIYRRQHDGSNRYTVLWVKNDLVYVIAGFGDPDEGVELANSLE